MITTEMTKEVLTAPPEATPTKKAVFRRLLVAGVLLLAGVVCLVLALRSLPAGWTTELPGWLGGLLTREVMYFALVGFAAQLIDGALGMAYGISSTSFLLSLGISPALASSSVHVAEVFTAGVSGLSHLRMGNVNRRLFQRLVLPGAIGAVVGAYVLTNIDGNTVKPFIAVYLLVMGAVIIWKALRKPVQERPEKSLAPLALFGGFIDAVGGGGWGPVVASTLLSKGHHPRYTIGSVNLAEFFIALAGAGTFVALIGTGNWQIIVGLVLGGACAAPFAAYLCRKVAPKVLMLMVGVLIIGLSVRTLVLTLL
ncbi:MAG: membrane protein, putative [uncultured Cytophagales bacterium]|uniref:Probable membrane transporter protein n=1 Tax=uncultured Cytophagales bacterium TaxID=158755 RepID=A0A6J4L3M1_9SPHI|nr:MAG: membrane protein, putative [uncultured Cytophagales bacterium]